MALWVAVVVSVAVGFPVTIAAPFLATAVTTAVALGAFASGLFLNARDHSRTWRTAWGMLGLALALVAVATTIASVGGWPTTFPAPLTGSAW